MKDTLTVGDCFYHFKHDASKGVNHMAYQVIEISAHTETEELLVVYKPLYDSEFLEDGSATSFARPLSMFIDDVSKENYSGPRFTKIADQEILNQLL